MPSFQILISPSRRAATRFIGKVRRTIQQAMIEEGISQSDLSRELGIHRSVVSREIRGDRDISLGRVGELAFLLGRKADFSMPKRVVHEGTNHEVALKWNVSQTGGEADVQSPIIGNVSMKLEAA